MIHSHGGASGEFEEFSRYYCLMASSFWLPVLLTGFVCYSVSQSARGQVLYEGPGRISDGRDRDSSSKVDTTLFLDRPVAQCGSIVVNVTESRGGEFKLEHGMSCQNETIRCWAGVRSGKAVKRDTPEGLVWSIPYVNLTITESCTLRLTKDGDLEFLISDLDIENGMPSIHNGVVSWSSNTAGKGAVEVQVQENSNLVLVNGDGKSAVWQSSTAPLLPIAPLVSTSKSFRINASLNMVFKVAFSSALLMSLELLQLIV